jgi:RNAse (barnase) inhibitor barstar
MAWQVALIIDHETDPGFLLSQMPVWAVSTEARRDSAPKLRADWESLWHPEPGLTLINNAITDNPAEVVDLIPTLEEHHPHMVCVRLIGARNSEALCRSMNSAGYAKLSETHDFALSFARPIEALEEVLDLSLDANGWKDADDFYDAFFRIVGAPGWHGRNLDALNDSISTGRINEVEVPYKVTIRNLQNAEGPAREMTNRFVNLIKGIQSTGCPVAIKVHE